MAPAVACCACPSATQAVLGGELEGLHAAELALTRLPGHAQDQVAVAHPRATAAEADIVEAGEGLVLARRLLQRRPQEFPERHPRADQDQARDQADPRQVHDRDAGGADHRDLAAACQGAEADERAHEGGDRQQIEGERRQAQQREPQRPQGGVTAAADVVLLTDEGDQGAEREEHRGHHQHRCEDGTHDVAIENAHRPRIR